MRLLTLSLTAFCFIGQPTLAQSRANTIEVDVECNFKPASGLGFILSSNGAIQKRADSVEVAKKGVAVVSFPYEEKEIQDDSLVTALVLSDKGDIAFGNVKPITPDTLDSMFKIPECPAEKIILGAARNEGALLQNLVEIRSARRGYAQTKVSRLMTEQLTVKLRKLERGLGFPHTGELSADLPPVELIDRLSRLLQVVKNTKSAKKQ